MRSGALLLALAATTACGSESGSPTPNQPTDPDGAVTWNRDIAPIVNKKCVGCHQTGGIGPMSLEAYDAGKHYAAEMLDYVQSGLMPPWGAQTTDECTPTYGFKDDPRMTADEQALFQTWMDQGMPEGVGPAARLPKPGSDALAHPDLHLTIPSSVEIGGSSDRFVCFVLDPGLTKDKYIRAVQVNPGNTAVVHHVLIFSDPNDQSAALADENGQYECFGGPQLDPPVQLLGAWAPGAVPAVMPDGVALQLRGGSKMVMQVHYHPTRVSRETDSSTSIDLAFTDKPQIPGLLALVGNFKNPNDDAAGGPTYGLQPGPDDPKSGPEFVIPPNATAHTESMRFLVQETKANDMGLPAGAETYKIFGVGTHMHYVGHDMKIDVNHADGSSECLVQTPDWDFNWRRLYYYDSPLDDAPTLHKDDVITMRCTYDNSMGNPFVRTALNQVGADSPMDVHLGESTLDEMCLGVFGVAIE